MENFIEGPIALEVKNVKLHKFRNTSKALICCLLKTQIKHTLMKRSVSSEMLQKKTETNSCKACAIPPEKKSYRYWACKNIIH